MNITKEEYKQLVETSAPKSKILANVAKAFFIGGGICGLGEILANILQRFFDLPTSFAYTSMTLIVIAAFLTGLNVFPKIAKHGGAGTLVPVTGFSNAITSSALEAKTEGFVFGVGQKIFTIAGPVLLYGIVSATIYGFFYYFFS